MSPSHPLLSLLALNMEDYLDQQEAVSHGQEERNKRQYSESDDIPPTTKRLSTDRSVTTGSERTQRIQATSEIVVASDYDGIVEKLIAEVQKYPWLYDAKLPEYRDVPQKQNAWIAISKVLGISPEDCSAKWKSLREKYTKVLRKMSKQRPGEIINAQDSKWPLMKQVDFLKGHIRSRRSRRPKSPVTTAGTSIGKGLGTITLQASHRMQYMNTGDETQAPVSDTWSTPTGMIPSSSGLREPPLYSSSCSDDSDSDICVNGKREARAIESELMNSLMASRTLMSNRASVEKEKGDAEHHFAMYVFRRLRGLPIQNKSMLQAKIIQMLHSVEYDDIESEVVIPHDEVGYY